MRFLLSILILLVFSVDVFSQEDSTYNDDDLTFPVFRGCKEDLSFEEQKLCTKEKIQNYIKLSFDTDVADQALPLEKSTRFKIEFTVNKKGKIENVTARANHRDIAVEAIKVTKRLPKFKKPATLRGKAIDMPFYMYMTIFF